MTHAITWRRNPAAGRGAAGEVAGGDRVTPGEVGEGAQFGGESVEGQPVGVPHDGHAQAVLGLGGEPEVHVRQPDDLRPAGVHRCVQFGEGGEPGEAGPCRGLRAAGGIGVRPDGGGGCVAVGMEELLRGCVEGDADA